MKRNFLILLELVVAVGGIVFYHSALAFENALIINLHRGSSGLQVKRLQAMLKTMPDIYPEGLVTGYFGVLTEKAVQRF